MCRTRCASHRRADARAMGAVLWYYARARDGRAVRGGARGGARDGGTTPRVGGDGDDEHQRDVDDHIARKARGAKARARLMTSESGEMYRAWIAQRGEEVPEYLVNVVGRVSRWGKGARAGA